jgi:hypothetical protein
MLLDCELAVAENIIGGGGNYGLFSFYMQSVLSYITILNKFGVRLDDII